MKPEPIASDVDVHGDNCEARICQSCGQAALLETYDSGTPLVKDGHTTQNCENRDEYIYSHQPAPFGVVVPKRDSDIIWEFQTRGLMCTHPTIRGSYIPILEPYIKKDKIDFSKVAQNPRSDDYTVNLVSLLVSTNREYNTKEGYSREYIWNEINNRLPFTYREADAPDGYPDSHEAWKWIEIVGENSNSTGNFTTFNPLIGERVLFVYPNSD